MPEVTLRILDANFNRVKEGLRVIEEFLRFHYPPLPYLEEWRNLRKELVKRISSLPLLSHRDSEEDAGKNFIPASYPDILSLLRANFSRIEEGLRVIEEISRLKFPSLVSFIMKLRFQIYSLEKKILTRYNRKSRLTPIGIYLITDENIAGKPSPLIVEEALQAGIRFIQLRDKTSSLREIICKGEKIRELTSKFQAVFILNDRIDVAMAVNADGVHLGEEDFPLTEARKILGEEKIIGVTARTLESALEKSGKDIDYIALGPVYPTPLKRELKPIGIDILRKAKETIPLPIVAIGGIREENIQEIIKTGVDGIAMVRALQEKGRVKENSEKLRKIWEKFHFTPEDSEAL